MGTSFLTFDKMPLPNNTHSLPIPASTGNHALAVRTRMFTFEREMLRPMLSKSKSNSDVKNELQKTKQVLRTGFLTKSPPNERMTSFGTHRWRSRWFELWLEQCPGLESNLWLSYFKNGKFGNLEIGKISIRSNDVDQVFDYPGSYSSHSHVILVTDRHSGRVYYLCAESEEQKRLWMKSFREAINRLETSCPVIKLPLAVSPPEVADDDYTDMRSPRDLDSSSTDSISSSESIGRGAGTDPIRINWPPCDLGVRAKTRSYPERLGQINGSEDFAAFRNLHRNIRASDLFERRMVVTQPKFGRLISQDDSVIR